MNFCHLNNVRDATLFEGGLLHCGKDTAVCVTKRESSETEAVELVERDDRRTYPQYPPPTAISSHTHECDFSTIFCNFQTILAAFFHRIYKLTNLATWFGWKMSPVLPREREVWLSQRSVASLGICSVQWAAEKQCIQLAAPQQTRQ